MQPVPVTAILHMLLAAVFWAAFVFAGPGSDARLDDIGRLFAYIIRRADRS